ncbi:glycosyltransferase [Paracoccus zeaxanthinifaciens]|uniref:glycosyltransferase n=1 Tax=Paracoccus zeaxanthinifaciens TaxID=187400 RepID=UPI0003B71D95|nr:glycosyltransferase [Paracoccus zeaxanthinifaciens]
MTRPIGYFVHHQGRGHAERCAAIVNALPQERPVTVFCARDDIFPPLRDGVTISRIPSLFEAPSDAPATDWIATPDTLHCAPVGWSSIRQATATMAGWFHQADPALMICDVSAEIAQLARICSVPHVKIVQHGDRSDPGHMAAYRGAAGLLAPFHADLAQPDWPDWMARATFHAPGLGVHQAIPDGAVARRRLGIAPDRQVAVVIGGGGGNGWADAPFGVAARSHPEMDWIVIGKIQRDWHATLPANLHLADWVDNPLDYLAAADVVVSSTGNTTCQQVLAAGKPWIAVPEWRYFDEQVLKAQALGRAGTALHLPQLPASAHRWREALCAARDMHDPDLQRRLAGQGAAQATARWIEELIPRIWGTSAPEIPTGKEASHAHRISPDHRGGPRRASGERHPGL